MFRALLVYLWGCACHAWRGSINSALNWASVIGIGVVGAYREHMGSPMSDPHTWEGIVEWTLVYTVVAWIIIFAVRLIFIAPFRLYYEQKTRADKLEGLRQIANDASKPPSFDLGFDYSPYDSDAHYLVDNYSVLRIWVENLEHRHIEDCRISIENFGPDPIIRKAPQMFEPMKQNRRPRIERKQMSSTDKRRFDRLLHAMATQPVPSEKPAKDNRTSDK